MQTFLANRRQFKAVKLKSLPILPAKVWQRDSQCANCVEHSKAGDINSAFVKHIYFQIINPAFAG
jgi:hypothetical protein